MYKFIISNGFIYYKETSYVQDPTYLWIPGKPGTYTVSVLIKNEVSYGKYDQMKSFQIEVK